MPDIATSFGPTLTGTSEPVSDAPAVGFESEGSKQVREGKTTGTNARLKPSGSGLGRRER